MLLGLVLREENVGAVGEPPLQKRPLCFVAPKSRNEDAEERYACAAAAGLL